MPKPDGSLSAIVVSGGKQYRVSPGDRILVDRVDAEPGSSLKLDRVLLFSHGDEIKVGAPAVDGVDVEVKVLAHRRGPRIETIRYKSKKRVRVHRGGRADLTALHVIAVGGLTGDEKAEGEEEPAAEAPKKRTGRSTKPKAEAVAAPAAATAEGDEKPKRAPRRAKKSEEGE